ncbi:MAG: F0F1 ATP synthase subunit A [Rhodospirillaceae bacterium]
MDPLHQFQIKSIFNFSIGHTDVSFSNSSLSMVAVVVIVYTLMMLGMRSRSVVPGRLQSLAEVLYEFVSGTLRDNAGHEARPFFPFVFTLFTFILFGNVIGMIPWVFTFTSHIIVTFAMAIFVFLLVTLVAIVRHGVKFFTSFMPHGVPMWLAPILIPIEVVSYMSRPISLSIRLFANMMAGHAMMKVFAGFVILMVSGMGAAGYVAGALPVAVNVALVGFELMVAFLQAYVFTILTCLYLKDAIHLH